MNNIKKITGFSSVAGVFLVALAFSILLVATTPRSVMAQNLTTNASNTAENMTATTNQVGLNWQKMYPVRWVMPVNPGTKQCHPIIAAI